MTSIAWFWLPSTRAELYNEGEAKKIIQMADYQIDWVEQPLGVYNIEGMALLRKMIPIRLAIDQEANTLG